MELPYTYWAAAEGGFIGICTNIPIIEHRERHSMYSEAMLKSLYDDLRQFDDIQSAVPYHTVKPVISA
jgi:hypothetical protein